MDPLEIIARLAEGATNPPTDAELASASKELRDALDAATSSDDLDIQLATDLREGLDTVVTEIGKRDEARAANKAAALKLRDGVFEEKPPGGEEEEEEEEAPEVAAVPRTTTSTVSVIERLKAHAAKVQPDPAEAFRVGAASLKAVGIAAADELAPDADFGELGRLFSARAKSVMSNNGSATLARLTRAYPETRTLTANVELNNKRLSEVLGFGRGNRSPLAASGGLCGPGDVDHTHPVCSEGGRPIRDALPGFNASRGTVTFMPAMSVGDMSANVSIWTAATDATPGAATKPCPPLECPEELSASVDAVVRCVTVGNFQATFSPEFWAASLETLTIAHDRLAEQKSIREIHAASTDVGAVDEGNTLASLLMAVNTILGNDRSAHRNANGRYRLIGDRYVLDQIRNQFIRNLGVANNVDKLQIADAEINGWLSDVGVDATWTIDGSYTGSGTTHRVLPPGGTTPATGGLYLFPEDAFLFLDGGTLDLGTSITDSTLNATNDRQAFAESFEKTTLRGCSAYRFTIPVADECGCPAPVGP